MEKTECFNLIKTIRSIAQNEGVENITINKLKSNPVIDNHLIEKYFDNDKQVAKKIFNNEQEVFEKLFNEENFSNNNAIDKLLMVSKLIAKNFNYMTPALYHHYQKKYPDIFQGYFDQRSESVYNRIQKNLVLGMQQGYYCNDLSVELVARGYISRLADMYNPSNFPAKDFSFSTFFSQMFETFILSIVTEKGMQYWQEKKE